MLYTYNRSPSYTNPTLRGLYRKARLVARAADIGDEVMCPCGCLKKFTKHVKSQIFLNSGDTSHKDTYYNRVRSKSNYAFDSQMFKIKTIMDHYVRENYVPVRKQKASIKKNNP